MLKASVFFFILGIIAMLLGLNGVAGLTFEAGRMALIAFLALAVLGFVAGLISSRRPGP